MKKRLLLISFDFIKETYASTSYSIATILASIKMDPSRASVSADHHSIDLTEIFKRFNKDTSKVTEHIHSIMWNELKSRAMQYDLIAVGATTWSNIYVDYFLNQVMTDYQGKVILGGYEVTAMKDEDLLEQYPSVNHFIKGYAETGLKKILLGEIGIGQRIVCEPLAIEDLKSPYLSKVLSTETERIHWETKRGCPYSCGFCEWGNAADKKVHYLQEQRLLAEIDLFKMSSVKEVNILDGTFNFSNPGSSHIDYLENLLYNTSAKVTMQVRFENLKGKHGTRFLEVCSKFRDRVKLEFGLQTIHVNEMSTIKRENNLSTVIAVMALLNEHRINYEVSLIYGIPGQTYESFFQTVEFVIQNGCENIRAFPLRIPKNSKMEQEKGELGVGETTLEFNVDQVTSSYSFDEKDYSKMQELAQRLYLGDPVSDRKHLSSKSKEGQYIVFEEANPFEWKIKNVSHDNPLVFYESKKSLEMRSTKKTDDDPRVGDNYGFTLKDLGKKVLGYALHEGEKYFRDLAKQDPFLRDLFKIIDLLVNAYFWTVREENEQEYYSNLKISDGGNVFIFKGQQAVQRRLGA